jgi:hypothetical protein
MLECLNFQQLRSEHLRSHKIVLVAGSSVCYSVVCCMEVKRVLKYTTCTRAVHIETEYLKQRASEPAQFACDDGAV